MIRREDLGSKVARGWFAAGKVLRLAADLDEGSMRVAVASLEGQQAEQPGEEQAGKWTTAFASGVRPSAAVGAALFPAVSGKNGARVRCNLGRDEGRPLRFAPPWGKEAEAPQEQVRDDGAGARKMRDGVREYLIIQLDRPVVIDDYTNPSRSTTVVGPGE